MSLPNLEDAGVAQLVEQLTCNQQVGGSIPFASSMMVTAEEGQRRLTARPWGAGPARRDARAEGRFPSGQREQTVNLSASAFGGSNPPLPTPQSGRCHAVTTLNVGGCAEVRTCDAGIAQLVERQPSKLGVAGSNPVSRSTPNGVGGRNHFSESRWLSRIGDALVAQSVEHFLGKEEVTGSIPVEGLPAVAVALRI